ncbi:MAG: hypothetical protein H6772_02000 [Pseudomonadales bacterium]|nr:hypothetical protein [Pseudomonadales bacterium]
MQNINNGTFTIIYKDVEAHLDPLVFTGVNKKFMYPSAKRAIATFDPMTLFQLYSIYGPIRKKDFPKLMKLRRAIYQNNFSHISREYFIPFFNFRKKIREKYPNDFLLGKIRYAYHDKFSQSTREKTHHILNILRKIFTGILIDKPESLKKY